MCLCLCDQPRCFSEKKVVLVSSGNITRNMTSDTATSVVYHPKKKKAEKCLTVVERLYVGKGGGVDLKAMNAKKLLCVKRKKINM